MRAIPTYEKHNGSIPKWVIDAKKWMEEAEYRLDEITELKADIMVLVKHPDTSQVKKDLKQKYLKLALK